MAYLQLLELQDQLCGERLFILGAANQSALECQLWAHPFPPMHIFWLVAPTRKCVSVRL